MAMHVVLIKIKSGSYESTRMSLVNAVDKKEAGQIALLGECHNQIGDGAEWEDDIISDLNGDCLYSVVACKEVPENEVGILKKYFNMF
jgi:hypothetical protein